MKLLKRIKNAWGALTNDDFVTNAFIKQSFKECEIGNAFVLMQILSRRYFSKHISDPNARDARQQMYISIFSDPSVILQSVHDGKPTVIYDCASEADLELLKSQDIETSNLRGHGDDTSF